MREMTHKALTVILGVFAAAALLGSTGWAADKGLIASYTFEEGPSGSVKDWSGTGNDGRIVGDVTYITREGGKGHALSFNNGQAYVDCGNRPSVDLRTALTIETWFRPETGVNKGEGGVVGKLMGSFSLSYSGKCWFYAPGGSNFASTAPLSQDWHHIVATFDEAEIRIYVDGRLQGVSKSKVKTLPEGGSFYLRYPATYQTVEPDYRCMLDNVRVYNRALSEAEAQSRYRIEARAQGLPIATWFDKPKLTPLQFPKSGMLVVKADISQMELPSRKPVVRVELRNSTGKVVLHKEVTPEPIGGEDAQIRLEFQDAAEQGVGYATLDVAKLPKGKYQLSAIALVLAGGTAVGKPYSVKVDLPLKQPQWIAAYNGAKKLNNLVAELLNVKKPQKEALQDYRFTNPRNGWVFISTKGGDASVYLDGELQPIIVDEGATGGAETMRHLSVGQHRLRVVCVGESKDLSLVVRAIPELMVAGLGYTCGGGWSNVPILPCFGAYNMEYMDKIGLLANLNTLIEQNPVAENAPYVAKWREEGKRLLSHYSQYALWQNPPTTAEEVFKAWTSQRGLKDKSYDGVIADEFSGLGHGGSASYPLYAEAIRRISRDSRLKDRVFYPYCMPMYPGEGAMDMLQAVVEGGYAWAEEKYLTEQSTEKAANEYIDLRLRQNLLRYEALIPGAAQHMITTLGFMSAPPETLNIYPSVDFKVYMDMQMHLLATDPVFFGLRGLHWYHNGYVDEEDLRWTSKLFRHYCIEGRTDRLTNDPYTTSHIVNADFDDGLKGWTIQPAEEGSIKAGHADGAGILETRTLPADSTAGDNFLLTTRSAKAPNRFSQVIKGLTTGRTYSVKLFTADYDEMMAGKSKQNPHAVNIQVAGAETLPTGGFHQMFPSGLAGHVYGPFKDGNNLYLTYHRVVFRAKASQAKLVISDWATKDSPGGPIGQTLLYNFIEVQPYVDPADVKR